jgi:hypothetical protein
MTRRGLKRKEGAIGVDRAQTDEPDLRLAEGWWWDLPTCRIDCDTTPREPDESYVYRDGPYRIGEAAYAAAMANDGGLDA